jgi:hypothetical protein
MLLPGQFEFALGLPRGQITREGAVLEGGEEGVEFLEIVVM